MRGYKKTVMAFMSYLFKKECEVLKRIIVLVGGSGTGKTTVANELEKQGFHRLVTTTTRPMRKGEINGIDYHFVKEKEFWGIERIEESSYAGNWYGLSKDEVDTKIKKYDDLVIVMDINGAKSLKKEFGDIVRVIFLTISKDEMKRRMENRGDSQKNIQERLQRAKKFREFEKPDIADIAIENNDLKQTIQLILSCTKKEAS